MKTISHLSAPGAVTFALCALVALSQISNAAKPIKLTPPEPTGWLTAFPTAVRTGTNPQLTWSITYPSRVENYVAIQAPATIQLTSMMDVEIRVVGAGVTTGGSDGSNENWVPTQALLSLNGGTYTSIFSGNSTDVHPDSLVWARRLDKDSVLRFGGRYYLNQWSQAYNSDSGGNNIRALVDGDYPPTAYALHSSPVLKSYMKPYLDGEGRINIGPLDVLVMMELTQPDSNLDSPFYTLQDMVLLVTCRPKGNNGHGNNVDGVDSSNPGKSKPVDPSGTVDDERSGGKK